MIGGLRGGAAEPAVMFVMRGRVSAAPDIDDPIPHPIPGRAGSGQCDCKARPHRIMPFEIIERVVGEAVGYGLEEIIPSTTGEPLL